MLDSGGVYKILNLTSGKCYIGSTATFQSRWLGHRRKLRRGKHHSPYLQSSWNKYGEANFVFVVIEIIEEPTRLIKREQYWIDRLKPEFNWGPTAGSPLGIKRSAVYKRTLKKVMRKYYQEHDQAMKGKTHTEESKLNFSAGHKGKPLCDMGHKVACICAVCKTKRGEKSGINHPRYIKREQRFCECGCGTPFICAINSVKRFISGHNTNLRYR